MGEDEEERLRLCSLLWSRWAGLRASATTSQCRCVPAALPGAEGCNKAGRERDFNITQLFILYYTFSNSFPAGGSENSQLASRTPNINTMEIHHLTLSPRE